MKPTARCLALLSALAATRVFACADVVVTDAWVRVPPRGATAAAAYFTLENRGAKPARIVGVESPDFAGGMLHETAYVEGVARMRHVEVLEIAPGATFRAVPGGTHVMFGAPRAPFAAGDVVQLRLLCAKGAALDLSATVAERAPAPHTVP